MYLNSVYEIWMSDSLFLHLPFYSADLTFVPIVKSNPSNAFKTQQFGDS